MRVIEWLILTPAMVLIAYDWLALAVEIAQGVQDDEGVEVVRL